MTEQVEKPVYYPDGGMNAAAVREVMARVMAREAAKPRPHPGMDPELSRMAMQNGGPPVRLGATYASWLFPNGAILAGGSWQVSSDWIQNLRDRLRYHRTVAESCARDGQQIADHLNGRSVPPLDWPVPRDWRHPFYGDRPATEEDQLLRLKAVYTEHDKLMKEIERRLPIMGCAGGVEPSPAELLAEIARDARERGRDMLARYGAGFGGQVIERRG